MKLKKIENAVVHCKTKEEAEQLVNSVATRNGNEKGVWIDYWNVYEEDTCYEILDGVVWYYGRRKSWDSFIEFSDLSELEPELTAEEAIEWLCNHYRDGEYQNAFGRDCTFSTLFKNFEASGIIGGITKWKADHEKQEPGKKEPEVECVTVCKIMKIDGSECEKCVYEETLLTDRRIDRQMVDILKRYIASHEGNFMAVQAFVCRAKKD